MLAFRDELSKIKDRVERSEYTCRLELQESIERTYNKGFINETIIAEMDDSFFIQYTLCSVCDDIKGLLEQDFYDAKELRIKELINNTPLYPLVKQMFVNSLRSENTQTIQSIIGKSIESLTHENVFDKVKMLSDIVVLMAKKDLFDLVMPSNSDTGTMMVRPIYKVNETTRSCIDSTTYTPPMVCEPKVISQNYDYDYVSYKSSKILGAKNHHNKKLALDALNIMNKQPLSLSLFVLNNYSEEQYHEFTVPSTINQHVQMAKESDRIYDLILNTGNMFYFTHKYDKRGRVYSQGYHINLQSSEYKRALIDLATPIKVNADKIIA